VLSEPQLWLLIESRADESAIARAYEAARAFRLATLQSCEECGPELGQSHSSMSPVDPARFKAPDLAANWLRIMYQKIKAHFVEPMLLTSRREAAGGRGQASPPNPASIAGTVAEGDRTILRLDTSFILVAIPTSPASSTR
jgi:hypothetical protein